jgi:serine/threonine-protein kinase RsbW/sigma-B regulation protein RsbU (phosphoserine phosphatase)
MTARQTIQLRNDLAEIPRLANFVDGYCRPLGASSDDINGLQLALEEVVTNVIVHGFDDGGVHHFTVDLEAIPGPGVIAVVTDDAAAYDPLARAAPDISSSSIEERPIGGLGVHLIRALMKSVAYERRGDRNVLTMEWVAGGPPRS